VEISSLGLGLAIPKWGILSNEGGIFVEMGLIY